MEEELPELDHDQKSRRIWKRGVKRVSKRRFFDWLRPVLVDLTRKLRSRDAGASNQQNRFIPVLDRKRVVLQALDEIHTGAEPLTADVICASPFDYRMGLAYQASCIMGACVELVAGMRSTRKHEQHFLACLMFVRNLDPDSFEVIHRELDRVLRGDGCGGKQ